MHRLHRLLRYWGVPLGHGQRGRHPRVAARQRLFRRSAAVLGLFGCLLLLAVQVPGPPSEISTDVAIVVADLPPVSPAAPTPPTVPGPSPAAPAAATPSPAAPASVDFTVELLDAPPLPPELLPPPVVADAEPGSDDGRGREMGVETLDLANGFLSVEPAPEPLRRGAEMRAAEIDPALPIPMPAPRRPQPAVGANEAGPAGPASVAIIIDDVGPAHAWSERAIALPGPLTMSFLPYADGLPAQTAEARRHGHEIFLHMPMQPLGDANPGKNALRTGMTTAEIRERLGWAIDRVDGAVGMNNHMGSRVTADFAAMSVVMDVLRQRGLMFVDSKTSPRSVAAGVAAEAGLAHTGRDVFLDHFPGPAFVYRQLAELESRARRTGTAVAIGHPLPTTLDVLRDWIPAAKKRGLRFVTVSQVISARGCDGRGAAGKCGLLQTVSRPAPEGG